MLVSEAKKVKMRLTAIQGILDGAHSCFQGYV